MDRVKDFRKMYEAAGVLIEIVKVDGIFKMTDVELDYVFALATANRFLHAWQTDDLETGMVLLSDRVRHSQDPEKFEQFWNSAPEYLEKGTRLVNGVGDFVEKIAQQSSRFHASREHGSRTDYIS